MHRSHSHNQTRNSGNPSSTELYKQMFRTDRPSVEQRRDDRLTMTSVMGTNRRYTFSPTNREKERLPLSWIKPSTSKNNTAICVSSEKKPVQRSRTFSHAMENFNDVRNLFGASSSKEKTSSPLAKKLG